MTEWRGRPPGTLRILGVLSALGVLAVGFAAATFHDAYRRGLADERAGRWEEARQAFLEAAHKRPEPARRVRTYGLNFLEHYDPYLHLARAELELGLIEEAAEHLRRSRQAGVSPARVLEPVERRLAESRRRRDRSSLRAVTRVPSVPPPAPPPPGAERTGADPPGSRIHPSGGRRLRRRPVAGHDAGGTPPLPPACIASRFARRVFWRPADRSRRGRVSG
ncbi:MAG: tetratricopeptide repeat protein [Acidobacteriota bacterium]|nr:tetratricopeptide repeat protein [Acidobacteriota bacterium]